MYVEGVEQRAQYTALVLRLRGEVRRLTLTLGLWLRQDRKLFIHIQMFCRNPRSPSMSTSLWGRMVLNAELKSTKSILTYLPCFFRWDRAAWRAVATASSVDLFAL